MGKHELDKKIEEVERFFSKPNNKMKKVTWYTPDPSNKLDVDIKSGELKYLWDILSVKGYHLCVKYKDAWYTDLEIYRNRETYTQITGREF